MVEVSEEQSAADAQVLEQELAKQYKRQLENWRELLYHLNSLLLWDKPYYPGIVAAFITFIFLLLWYFEPSILTTLSIIGVIVCLLDYIVPVLSSSVFDSNKWTGVQERKFEEICENLAHMKHKMQNLWNMLTSFREKNPKKYFLGVVGFLILMAWIGNLVDNLFLSYLFTVALCLYPGIEHHNIWQMCYAQASNKLKKIKKDN